MATAKKTAAPEATETTAASTEVAPVNTESTAVATAAPVNMESMLLQSAGQGFEEVTQQDTSTPRIVVLQKGNPQVNKQEAAYVKGSEVGMFYNTATKQFYPASEEDDNGILVVPCFFTAVEMEFKPNRGGFAGIRLRADVKDDEIVESKGADGKKSRIFADTGNDAVLTKQHYCLLLEQDAEGNPTGSYAPVLVPLKGMGLRASTSWMTMAGQQMLNGRKLPMFSTIYRLKTVWGKNDQGDFYMPTVELYGRMTDLAMFQAAKTFYEGVCGNADQLTKDAVATNADSQNTSSTSQSSNAAAGDMDDDIPF